MRATLGLTPPAAALLALIVAGCDQASPVNSDADVGIERDGGPLDATDAGEAGALLPWTTGNTWTYRVTDADGTSQKVTTIGEEERVGGDGPNSGMKAFKVVTKKGQMDQTISWQVDRDGKVVRLREQSFSAKSGELALEEHWDPYKLHIDGNTPEHLVAGATWLEEYRETKESAGKSPTTATARDRWTVTSLSESVTVPAGTFDAVVLQKAGGSSLKKYWYVWGVGKVKETGGQTEELLSYEVAP